VLGTDSNVTVLRYCNIEPCCRFSNIVHISLTLSTPKHSPRRSFLHVTDPVNRDGHGHDDDMDVTDDADCTTRSCEQTPRFHFLGSLRKGVLDRRVPWSVRVGRFGVYCTFLTARAVPLDFGSIVEHGNLDVLDFFFGFLVVLVVDRNAGKCCL
jgi:hypothetical protein